MDERSTNRNASGVRGAHGARPPHDDRAHDDAAAPQVDVLEVRFLGGFEASWRGAPLTGLASSRRTRSLVQQLVVARGTPVARDELAFELWPDVVDAQARANLRQALVRAGRVLPREHEFVVSTATSLAWNVDAPAVVDLLRFDECMRFAEAARADGDRVGRLAALREAVSLYRGDLSVDVSGGRMERARTGLHEDVLHALNELVALHLTDGRTGEAIACCERLLEIDPLDEPTYLRLMGLYEAAGAPRKGLLVYERLRATLREEVASDPSLDSEAVAMRLGERTLRTGHDDEALSTHDQARMAEAARRARSEGTQYVVVRGGGRRSFVARAFAEFTTDHVTRAVTVLAARATSEETRLPFATAARLLGPTRLGLAAARVDAPWSTELRRLAGAQAHTLPPSRTGADTGQLGLVFAALTAALQLEHGPVHVVVEDAEHVDAPSAGWLRSLMQAVVPGPVVVLALGDVAADGPSALQSVLALASDRHRTIEVDTDAFAPVHDGRRLEDLLRGLTEPARRVVEALAVLGLEAPPETIRRVAQRSRGSVASALEELTQRGVVEPSRDGRTVALRSSAVRDAVLAGMAPATRALLHGQAADVVRGGPQGLARHDAIVADHLERSGRLGEAASAWAEAARRAASVAELDVAIEGYERAIALTGDSVYGTSNPALTTLWRELGEVHARRLDGERARRAFAEASRHAGDDPVTLATLALRRAETYVAERVFDDALAELDLASAALRSGSRRSRGAWRASIDIDALRARALYFLPNAVDTDGDTPDTLLRRLERAVARHGTLTQRFEVDQAALRFTMRAERYRLSEATRARADRAERTARATGDGVTIADARFGVGFATLFGGDPDTAIAQLEDARHAAERSGIRLLFVQSVAYLGVACRLAGRVERLQAVQGELEAMVGASTTLYAALAHAQRGYLDYLAGDAVAAHHGIVAALDAWGDRWYPFRWTASCTLLAVASSDAAARDAAAAMLGVDQQRPPPVLEHALERLARARTSLGARRDEALAAARATRWL